MQSNQSNQSKRQTTCFFNAVNTCVSGGKSVYEQMKMGTCTQVSVLLPKIP